jgi:transposase
MKCFEFATRFDLTDEEYELLKPFLPPEHSGKAGRPWAEHRKTLDGIFWILRTGAPWRDLPARYGPWSTVHNRLSRWRKEGRWQHILDRFEALARKLDRIDFSLGDLDGSVIRAHKAAAGAEKKAGPDGARKPAKRGPGTQPGRTDHQDPCLVRGCRTAHCGHDHAGASG